MLPEATADCTGADRQDEPELADDIRREVKNVAPPYTAESGSARIPPSWGGPLNENDYANLESSGITREIADEAMLRRMEDYEGSEVVGQRGRRSCAGLLFPYYWPGEPGPFNYRVRRDNPDWIQGKDGKLKQDKKYLGAPNSGNRLYIPPGVTPEQLQDVTIPIAIVEGEKGSEREFVKGCHFTRLSCCCEPR